jgi:hypothetical protein
MTTLYKNFKTALVALTLSVFVMQADAVAQNANNHSFGTDITAVSPTTPTTNIKDVQTPTPANSTWEWISDLLDFSSWIWGDSQNDEVLPKGPDEWEIDDFDIGG